MSQFESQEGQIEPSHSPLGVVDDIIAEVKNKSESILNLNSDPVAIVNGIKPIVFSYIKSGNLTKNQAIETASRMVALVSLVSAGSSMPDVR